MPSSLSLNIQHHKKQAVNALRRHDFRLGKKHSNEKIDPARTHLNHVIIDNTNGMSNARYIQSQIDERCTGRVTKASVYMTEFTVQVGKDMKDAPINKQDSFFEAMTEFISEKYGKENIISAVAHHDETSAHLHLQLMPFTKDNRLSRKDLFNGKQALQVLQAEALAHAQKQFPEYDFRRLSPNERGFDNGKSQKDFERLSNVKNEAKKELNQLDSQLSDKRIELENLTAQASSARQQLIQSRQEANTAYAAKKSASDAYNDQWGKYKERMAEIRQEHEHLFSPEQREHWDNAAVKLRETKRTASSLEWRLNIGKGSFLDLAFLVIEKIRQQRFEAQLNAMNEARAQSLNEISAQRQAAKDELAQYKEARDSAKADFSTYAVKRNTAQAQYNTIKAKLDDAKTVIAASNTVNQQLSEKENSFKEQKQRLNDTWERVLSDVRRGELRPQKVEQVMKPFQPLDLEKQSDELILTMENLLEEGQSL